jgi:RNA polymerase sigma-70 factor (ECF subfamily)
MSPDPISSPQPELEPRFEALVRAQYPRLFGVAFSYLRSAEAAEDAVQAALLNAWRQRMVLELPDPLPYLFRAVRNECVSTIRRRQRWHEVELDTEGPDLRDPTPMQDLEAGELEAAVRAAIEELPPRCRLVFLLSREQHLGYAEIARTLDISPKTVEAQMGKALRLLRVRLAQFLSLAISAASGASLFGSWHP